MVDWSFTRSASLVDAIYQANMDNTTACQLRIQLFAKDITDASKLYFQVTYANSFSLFLVVFLLVGELIEHANLVYCGVSASHANV